MKHPSRNWKAMELSDFVGREYNLTITGDVETFESNQVPKLAPAHPQGIVKEELILDLTVETTGGIPSHIARFVTVEYHHEISAQEYRTVRIRGDIEDAVISIDRVLS